MNAYYYIDEEAEEIGFWEEYYQHLRTLEEQYKEEDPFTGSLEDYGMTWRDFYA